MSDARLVAHQLRYELLAVWRDPQSRFFTIVPPLIFLVLLTSLFGNHTLHVHGHAIKDSTYYVPGISTPGIIATAFVNLVITITGQRQSGVLKRRRSSPVPAWVLIASRTLTSAILASAMVAVIVAIGRLLFGVQLPSPTLPAFVLGVIVGAAAFCCLSFAAASFIRNEDSAQPIVQAIILPLYFISGVLLPKDQLSSTLREIASVFPVSHAPKVQPDRDESRQWPALVPNLPDEARQAIDARWLDATQGRKIGSDPYDDPTQGRQIGSDSYDDATQGRKLGADPYDDPTQGQKIGSDPYDDPTRGR